LDVICLGLLVADVIARPVDELPAPGSLALVDGIDQRGGGCALNTATRCRPLPRWCSSAGTASAPSSTFRARTAPCGPTSSIPISCTRALHPAGALVMEGLDGEPFARLLAGARERGLLTSLTTLWDATAALGSTPPVAAAPRPRAADPRRAGGGLGRAGAARLGNAAGALAATAVGAFEGVRGLDETLALASGSLG
jgi:hypothetical protein